MLVKCVIINHYSRKGRFFAFNFVSPHHCGSKDRALPLGSDKDISDRDSSTYEDSVIQQIDLRV